MPKFSVIIPAYQAADTIGRALESVFAQTHPAHEVIVCDDGSTDDLDSALSPYTDRIILVRQKNLGLTAARNRAMEQSTGDWIVLLDADDEYLPGRLEALAERLRADRSIDLVTTDAWIRRTGEPDKRYYLVNAWPRIDQRTAIIRGNFIFVAAAVRKTNLEKLGGFRSGYAHDSEYPTWTTLILGGSVAALVDQPLAVYHQGAPGQLSGNRSSTYRMVLQLLDEIEGEHGEEIDAAVSDRRRLTQRLLAASDGVKAIRNGDRLGALSGAFARRTPAALRLKLIVGAIAPRFAARRIS